MIKTNLIELFKESFLKYWEYDMYSDYGKEEVLTYRDVAKEIMRWHAYFDAIGLKPGDKVSLLGRNSTEWAVSYLATITYGLVIVPILADFKPQDVAHVVNHSESVLLVADERLWETLEEDQMKGLKVVFSLQGRQVLASKSKFDQSKVDAEFGESMTDFTKENLDFKAVDNKELMVLNYTSGTTGYSKGVMIPANSLAGNVTYAQHRIPLDEGSTLVSFLPLAHTYGCAFDFLLPVIKGVHVYFITRIPAPKLLVEAFKEVKPQVILSVPMVIEKIFKKQILPIIKKPHMQVILNVPGINKLIGKAIRNKLLASFGGNINEIILGGAALGHEAELFFRKIKFPFTVGYGMTECGPLISYENTSKTRVFSCGRILEGIMELKIDSSQPYEKPGEILVKGENLMYGYYKNEEATNEALDKDGWLHTGDMGVTDADGFIYIKGRSKSMYLSSNGQNIYPDEIQAKLNNMPFVLESLILEDDKQALVALIVADEEEMRLKGEKREKLDSIMAHNIKHLNKLVASYEKISRFVIYPQEFEKTPKKSIKRFLYEDMV